MLKFLKGNIMENREYTREELEAFLKQSELLVEKAKEQIKELDEKEAQEAELKAQREAQAKADAEARAAREAEEKRLAAERAEIARQQAEAKTKADAEAAKKSAIERLPLVINAAFPDIADFFKWFKINKHIKIISALNGKSHSFGLFFRCRGGSG